MFVVALCAGLGYSLHSPVTGVCASVINQAADIDKIPRSQIHILIHIFPRCKRLRGESTTIWD